MSDSPCATFQSTVTAAFGSPGPLDVPDEQLLHIHGCEGCLVWLDAFVPEGLSDDETGERLISLIGKIDALAKTDLPPDATLHAMREVRDRRDAEIETAVRGLIARYPQLDPAAHAIPMDRFGYLIFFTALDGVNMLIRHIVSRHTAQPVYYGLRDDGEVFVDGASTVPASSVLAEIREWIVSQRIVPEAKKTPDLFEALREEASWRDDETCAKLAAWIVRAVRLKPELMRNFRMIGTDAKDPRIILLAPIKTGTGDRDAVALWNE